LHRIAPLISLLIAVISIPACKKPPDSSSQPTSASASSASLSPTALSDPSPRSPLPRRDAFFGLHFDLHPNETDTALGADVTEEMVGRLLDRVRPDYVQYDCKGHAGWAGYPTKVGWAAPGIKKDSLSIWRKATRERGVGLYIHYSGVWDSRAIAEHPDWARIDEKGNRDPNNTSVFGPYIDELLVPQLKEVTAAYDLDGLWVDGECWAAQLDYSPRALAAWKKETSPLPRLDGDALGPDGLGIHENEGPRLDAQNARPAHAGGGGRPDAGGRLPDLQHPDPLGLHPRGDHRPGRPGGRLLPGKGGGELQEHDRPPGRPPSVGGVALG